MSRERRPWVVCGLYFVACLAPLTFASAAPILSPAPTLGGAPLASFEGFAEGTLIGGGVYPGVTFSQDDGGTPMIDNSPFLFAYGAASGVGVLTGSTTGGAPFPTVAGLVIDFATPQSAVEWFLSDTAPLGTYTINAFGAGMVLLESFAAPPQNYVGFLRGASDIVRVTFDSDVFNDAFAMDDLRVARAPVVAEPASLLLLGGGVAAVMARSRRRSRRTESH